MRALRAQGEHALSFTKLIVPNCANLILIISFSLVAKEEAAERNARAGKASRSVKSAASHDKGANIFVSLCIYFVTFHNPDIRTCISDARSSLHAPRAVDEAAAALDDAPEQDDLSIADVGPATRAPGSRSPTPPPSPSANLADALAENVARGESPRGIDDADALLEGSPQSDEENSTAAVAAAEARRSSRKHNPAPAKAPEPAPAPPSHAGKTKRPRPKSPEVIDSDDDVCRSTSRHKPVSSSAIVITFDGATFVEVRRRFQTLVFARDGFPLRTNCIYRQLNFKTVLQAAKDVMDKKLFTDFKNATEAALRDTAEE